MAGEGVDEVLQLEEGTGEVRRGRKGAGEGARGSSSKGREMAAWRREDGMAAVVRSAGANTRPRREGKGGDGVLGHAREGGREGKERGHGGDGTPFISGHVGVGDDPWAMP
jgi:hypothetical protein